MSQQDLPDSRKGDVILRNLIRQLLTDDESIRFKIALHNFKITKSITTLCQQLKPIINSTEKIMLLLELSTRLPISVQQDFHRICNLQYPHYDAYYQIYHSGNAMPESTKVIAKDKSGNFKIVSSSSDSKLYNSLKKSVDQSSVHGTSVTSGIYSEHDDVISFKHMDVKDNDSDVFVWTSQNGKTDDKSSTFVPIDTQNIEIKRVFLERQNGSLGIGIRGGKEYGTEIFVNHVDEGGAAANQGIQVGDRILEVNGTLFNQLTHAEAVTLMRNAWNVIMLVQNGPHNGEKQEALHIKEVELVVFPSSDFKLGCATNRKQRSKFLKVKAVDKNSPSEKAGLMVNDFIVKIDGIDVRTLSDMQIMSLTRSKRLTLLVKRLIADDELLKSSEKITNKIHRQNSEPHNFRSGESFVSYHDNEHSSQLDNLEDHHPSHERVRAIYSSPFSPHTPYASDNLKTLESQQRFVYKSEYIAPPARGRSEHRIPIQYDRRSHSAGRDSQPVYIGRPGVRYIRSRSQSPHILRQRTRYSKHDLETIMAIQRGMEKRQRAMRLSMYQASSIDNLDWEL